jgi:hypothetical protein
VTFDERIAEANAKHLVNAENRRHRGDLKIEVAED